MKSSTMGFSLHGRPPSLRRPRIVIFIILGPDGKYAELFIILRLTLN